MMMIESKEQAGSLRNQLGWVLIGIVFLSIIVNILQLVIGVCLSWRRIRKQRKNVVVKIRPIVSISIPNITRLEVIQEL